MGSSGEVGLHAMILIVSSIVHFRLIKRFKEISSIQETLILFFVVVQMGVGNADEYHNRIPLHTARSKNQNRAEKEGIYRIGIFLHY